MRQSDCQSLECTLKWDDRKAELWMSSIEVEERVCLLNRWKVLLVARVWAPRDGVRTCEEGAMVKGGGVAPSVCEKRYDVNHEQK